MAFKMNGSPMHSGTAAHKSALKMAEKSPAKDGSINSTHNADYQSDPVKHKKTMHKVGKTEIGSPAPTKQVEHEKSHMAMQKTGKKVTGQKVKESKKQLSRIGVKESKTQKVGQKLTESKKRLSKPTYKEAWANMSDDKKAKHGSYETFEKAAIDWNAKNKPKKRMMKKELKPILRMNRELKPNVKRDIVPKKKKED